MVAGVMEYKAESLGRVIDLGKVFYVDAPLPEQLMAFYEVGITNFVDIDKDAMIRLANSLDDRRLAGTRTSITPVIKRGEPLVLYKPSLLLQAHLMNLGNARIAVLANERDRYPTFHSDVYDVAREIAEAEMKTKAPGDRIAQIFRNGAYNLGQSVDETRFLFPTQGMNYFREFALFGGIPFVGIDKESVRALPKDKAIVCSLWFGESQGSSGLYCRYGGLNHGYRAFGVAEKTAEGSSRK